MGCSTVLALSIVVRRIRSLPATLTTKPVNMLPHSAEEIPEGPAEKELSLMTWGVATGFHEREASE